jgi:protein-S-isoprenylcysteine O-methyltransferase Ste14
MPETPLAAAAESPGAAPKPRTPALVIGSVRITGWRFQLIQIVIFGAIGALIGTRLTQSAKKVGWSQTVGHVWPLYASVALWVAFSAYWSAAAQSASAARSSESRKSRSFHVLLLNGSMLLIYISLPGLGGRFVPDTQLVHIIGIGIQAAFLLFAVWARRHLGRNWSGDVTVKADHELVRTGPYRRIRHPIYTAMFGMYAGAAIAIGEVHSLVALGILILAYARKIGLEETALRGEFGAVYDDYRRHSWAVVPPIW